MPNTNPYEIVIDVLTDRCAALRRQVSDMELMVNNASALLHKVAAEAQEKGYDLEALEIDGRGNIIVPVPEQKAE